MRLFIPHPLTVDREPAYEHTPKKGRTSLLHIGRRRKAGSMPDAITGEVCCYRDAGDAGKVCLVWPRAMPTRLPDVHLFNLRLAPWTDEGLHVVVEQIADAIDADVRAWKAA